MTFSETAREIGVKRNLLAFWIFGLCNNFAYSVMNSAAHDILSKKDPSTYSTGNGTDNDVCLDSLDHRHCTETSAGVVLICNILPSLLIKLLAPFFIHWLPYSIRHIGIVFFQLLSLIIVAFSDSVPLALLGVMIGSAQSGFGETSYLGMASHYNKHTVSTWCAGTGMAGISGSFSYALLTDSNLLALSPKNAMLVMLVVPTIFFLTYYFVLQRASTVAKISILKPSEWLDLGNRRPSSCSTKETETDTSTTTPRRNSDSSSKEGSEKGFDAHNATFKDKMILSVKLLHYMLPLGIVYFAEYLINQGVLELTIFDCSHGFGTSTAAQYRWFQVLYQVGVFISRSSGKCIQMNMTWIALMPVIQLINMVFLIINAIYHFIPHFGIAAGIVLFEGLIGGGSYVNTFNHIHKEVSPDIREFALSTVSIADSVGILAAAFAAIPVHNAICRLPW